ncbi:hypothetical protein [Idiomarina sp.]|uniref:hypothetical protein n=1 Tax=Idiomarina sp. TaxID=1874361 RepID=UPI003A9338E4
MGWELINGITGIISAFGAFSGIGYVALAGERSEPKLPGSLISLRKLASFTIACSGWALCCLAFLWAAEPYGAFVSDRDYQQFFGIILAFPALVIFIFGVNLLQGGERNKSSKKDARNTRAPS